MQTITFNMRALAAAAAAMAKKDVRFYLNGVSVETLADGGLALVGASGHVMVVARDPVGTWSGREDDKPAQLILPRDFVAALLKATKGDDAAVALARTGGGYALTFECAAGTLRATSIDGRFPDWRCAAATHAREPGDMAAFDPAVLQPALDAATAIQKRARSRFPVAVQFYGVGEAGTGFLLTNLEGLSVGGVVMPMRDSMRDRADLAGLVAA